MARCQVLLVVAWLVGASTFHLLARMAKIEDGRASQVSLFFGAWVLAASAAVFVAPMRGASVVRMRSACLGFVFTAMASGGALLGLATMVVVTPPAAWLIVTVACALGWMYGWRASASRAL
jgi:hypothetical protein